MSKMPICDVTTLSREALVRRGLIRTYSGRYVNPLKLRASDICIEDIAHHLSLICRYTGACPYHYSVAQHCVLVSNHMQRNWNGCPTMALAGLLHDASEAYYNDIASPVKHDPRMAFYRELEHEAGRMIFCKFGLDPSLMEYTKPSDDAIFFEEVRSWWAQPEYPCTVNRWEPREAERLFLGAFKLLGGKQL